tara:strand:- start:885 stop:1172 length:288 start_codon:yes stop_codon:yes gene_type:complete
MTPEDKLKALRELEASNGWAIIQAQLQTEIVETAFTISNPGPKSDQDFNFERGTMWAGRQLIALVPKLCRQLDNEILLKTATAKAAKAATTTPPR